METQQENSCLNRTTPILPYNNRDMRCVTPTEEYLQCRTPLSHKMTHTYIVFWFVSPVKWSSILFHIIFILWLEKMMLVLVLLSRNNTPVAEIYFQQKVTLIDNTDV